MTQTYPLAWPENWPRVEIAKRKSHSPFSTTFDKDRRDLLDELRRLGARNVVISSWLPLRQDGQPRADVARRRIEEAGAGGSNPLSPTIFRQCSREQKGGKWRRRARIDNKPHEQTKKRRHRLGTRPDRRRNSFATDPCESRDASNMKRPRPGLQSRTEA